MTEEEEIELPGYRVKGKDGKLRNTKFPVIYAALYPSLVAVARQYGYALAMHGSLTRDFDLIAIPWTEEAVDADTLAGKILESLEGRGVNFVGKIGEKPHGRRVWTIMLENHAFIDFGVMPLVCKNVES